DSRGPNPRTSKRHPGTDLHAPKDHQDGTNFRLPFGIRLGLPSGPRPEKGPFQTRSNAQSSFGGKLTSEPNKSVRSPSGISAVANASRKVFGARF
ncbi:hypothetical protein CRG98_038303, partial [Punica granatum]